MQGIVAFAAVVAAGVGLSAEGLVGAVTGLVAAVGAGSGVTILFGERGTVTAAVATSSGMAQRTGGVIAAAACLAGALHGGWRLGWLWGLGG